MAPKKSVRLAPPAHYTLKIECFSLLLGMKEHGVKSYQSDLFEVDGYKWKLCVYPNGHTKQGGEGYLSLYLAIVETQTRAAGWEVSVNSKMFVFNHNDGKFLTVEDDKVWRFHKSKTEWGIPHLISLQELQDPSRGFLFKGLFICGVEIYPVKHNGNRETLSIEENLQDSTYTWNISNFSAIEQEITFSDEFDVGGHKWNLQLNPRGARSSNGEHLSLYLNIVDAATCLPREKKMYTRCYLKIKDQRGVNIHRKQVVHWFSSSNTSCGIAKFISLSDLNDSSKGFLVNDSIVVEVQILAMSQMTPLT